MNTYTYQEICDMTATISRQPKKYVKSIFTSHNQRIEEGKVYEVIAEDEYDYSVSINGTCKGWWEKSHFVPAPATYDPVEEKLRAILTTTTDPYTCPKCGAPKMACMQNSYHG